MNRAHTYDHRNLSSLYLLGEIASWIHYMKSLEELVKIKLPYRVQEYSNGDIGLLVYFIANDMKFIFIGYNIKDQCNNKDAYDVSGILGKQLYNTDSKYLILLNENDMIRSHITGIMQGLYKFTKYNSMKVKVPMIDIYFDGKKHIDVDKIIKLNEIQNEIRDYVNEPVNILHSMEYLKRIKKSLSKYKNIKISVLNEEKMKKLGLNLILAVNKGSNNPALLVVIEYMNNNLTKDNICLVGKGVMFDTGGINLKTKNFYDMKTDMTGSAIVFGVMKALAELNIKKNVIGIMPIVENDIGSNATHPGDIIKSYSGKTVEIMDTDAEGRLILADAISYSIKYKPKIIIDIATLTGHMSHVFGELATGVMGNDSNLNKKLISHGIMEHEKMWEMPIWEEYTEMTKSSIADLKNIAFNSAGSLTAGAFLQEFVPNKNIKWAHLDIAGVSYNLQDKKYRHEGATGEIFRTLVSFLSE
jgi:leucyl aminopeptidase